jgi:hypothetical protein
MDLEHPDTKAIRLLERQLDELQTLRGLNYRDPKFWAWRDTTQGVLDRFCGKESHHTVRFRDMDFFYRSMVIDFSGGSYPANYISPEDQRQFQEACASASELLRAAIREIQDFGARVEEPKAAPAGRRGKGGDGGVRQTFNAPVTIHSQAIATDDAIQNIGQMGDQAVGASLKEIAALLRQSEELSPRQVREGLAHIEAVAVEEQKPESHRDWAVLLDRCRAILDLVGKASDLGHKLAPYSPHIVALVEAARLHLGQ